MTAIPYPLPTGAAKPARFSVSPGLVLILTLILLLGMATMPLTVPIGPMYWDLAIYIDGAYRVLDGQIPNVDFFPPVGALGYWLLAGAMKLFPNGHPLLLADWSLLLVTAPLMALVVAEVDRQSRSLAFALLLPFLFFSILPFNTEFTYAYAGVDGFGIYNRQTDRILYVLCAVLVFGKDEWRKAIIIAGTMLSLFLLKITGFLAGGIVCAYALLAGRIPRRAVIVSVALCLIGLAGLEIAFGSVSAYLRDIAALVSINEGGLASRFLQAASVQLAVFAPAVILTALLFFFRLKPLLAEAAILAKSPNLADLAAFLDKDVFAIGVTTFAALFFETQNAGGQAFIFLWPALLRLLTRLDGWSGGRRLAIILTVAATAMPSFVNVAGRASRAIVSEIRFGPFENRNLKTLGLVSQRPEIIARAAFMQGFYPKFPETFDYLRDHQQSPSFLLYYDPDFHLTQFMAIDAVIDAIRLFEMAEDVHFDTVMTLNFANPMAWLLDRHATKYIAIGAEPWRTVPPPTERVADAVRNTDLVLYPKCPPTEANAKLLEIYAPFLTTHRRIELTPCFDAFIRDGLAKTP